MCHAQHQKQKNEGKQHPNDDVHLVDREGKFIVELFLGVDEIRVVVVQQSLFLSALWALAAASSACSFPAGPPAGQAVPHGGPALPPAGPGSFLPWWYPPAFFYQYTIEL